MLLLWLKAFHVVAVISWMAAMLYFWRLLVYHAMETEPVVIERLKLWQRKLRRAIMTPAMIATVALGVGMLVAVPAYLRQPWLHLKLLLVLLLLLNHGRAVQVARRLAEDPRAYNHRRLRFLNEVPTLLMIGIVLLVVLKPLLWARGD